MTEEEARQVLLLQAVETAPALPGAGGPHAPWTAEDARWATSQAVAAVGEQAGAQRFVVARAALALQRLLPRDAAARRWLSRRGWHPLGVAVALLLGAMAGLLADQLGAPQRVNLLAPAVWAVVAWNLAVYLVLLVPLHGTAAGSPAGLRRWLAGLGLRNPAGGGAMAAASAAWARHAAPLMAHRAALVLHAAAAALALGLVAGLYLRGLVLDYRAGWQSTFLDAATLQQALGWLLAPASVFTGIAVPDLAPLRLAPGADASASAAPWIHLYAATLLLAVVLPRATLALWAAWRAGVLARRFPLPLDTPYFEGLHPLMRPGRPRVLRLLWVPVDGTPPAALFGTPLAPAPSPGSTGAPLSLLRSDEDDELQLLAVPPGVPAEAPSAPWWAPAWVPWRRVPADAVPALRDQVAGVLLLATPGATPPPWLARLGRPVVQLLDAPGGPPAPGATAVPLHQRDDGWLPEGRLLQALAVALEGDARLQRLAAAWKARQAAAFDARVAGLASTLAVVACAREPVADEGALLPRPGGGGAAAAARERLLQQLEQALAVSAPPGAPAVPGLGRAAGEGAALRARTGEGRAALVGGVLSGALAGLKADLATGGLTLGAGAVAGAVVGGLASAGAARGLNLVRGTDRSFVAWDEAALARITETLLQRALVSAWGLGEAAAAEALAPALAAQQGRLATLWRARQRQFHNPGEAEALAASLRSPLADILVQALGGPRRP